ncbi:unnamed protein product [Mytilus coruscus]|uniref:Uncharacterized protein n=1 Tax=Mytilus coruscus TaxID=42192 RepID=A0A6J8CJF0_MYTCO|nr:unnamed protein product [Mytilus coruscus]
MNNWSVSTKPTEFNTAFNMFKVDGHFLISFTRHEDIILALYAAMSNMFGDHEFPETNRQELHTLRIHSKNILESHADDCGLDDIEVRKVGGKRVVIEERSTKFKICILESLEIIIYREMTKYNRKQDPGNSKTSKCTEQLDLEPRMEIKSTAEPRKGITGSIIDDQGTAATTAVPMVFIEIVTNADIDTGANVTVLSEKLYKQTQEIKLPKLGEEHDFCSS